MKTRWLTAVSLGVALTATAVAAAPTSTANVAGLYLATTRQLRFSPTGGSDWEVRTEFYLLSADGQVFRGRDLPTSPGGAESGTGNAMSRAGADINRFDYAAARREAPGNYGTYLVRGDVVAMRIGDSPVDSIEAKLLGADALEIRSTKYTRSIRGRATGSPTAPPVTSPSSGAPTSTPGAPVSPATAAADAPALDPNRPRLAYIAPPDFSRVAVQRPIAYIANGTPAGFSLYSFRVFTGDVVADFRRTMLVDWIVPNDREKKLAGAPEFFDVRVPGATRAMAVRFHEYTMGTQVNERMRLLIVHEKFAALVDLQAYNSEHWTKVGPALGALVDSLRVEPKK